MQTWQPSVLMSWPQLEEATPTRRKQVSQADAPKAHHSQRRAATLTGAACSVAWPQQDFAMHTDVRIYGVSVRACMCVCVLAGVFPVAW